MIFHGSVPHDSIPPEPRMQPAGAGQDREAEKDSR